MRGRTVVLFCGLLALILIVGIYHIIWTSSFEKYKALVDKKSNEGIREIVQKERFLK